MPPQFPEPPSHSKRPAELNRRYQSYVDPTGDFGAKEFTYGLWFVEHKVELYKAAIFLIGLLVALTWVFALVRGIGLMVYALGPERTLFREITTFADYTGVATRFSAAPLQVLSSQVLPGGASKYDFTAEVANPNDRFLAAVRYSFVYGDTRTPVQTAIIPPGETRFLTQLGVEDDIGAVPSTLSIDDVMWQRIDPYIVPSTTPFRAERMNFSLSDVEFTRAETTPGLAAHVIHFTVTNNSPFGFKDAPFYVGLYANSSLVAVLPIEIKDFRSLETRTLDIRSFIPNLIVTDAVLYPRINIYDPAVYMAPAQ